MTKPMILVGLGLLLLNQLANAQSTTTALDQDPVFRQVVTHRIQYPIKPATRAIYGRFYAGFSIDQQGHIRDIAVLYPKMSATMSKRYGFDYEIRAGLNHMPPLNPRLVGSYVLPIAFCFTHYGEGPNPLVPTNVMPKGYDVGERVMLSEVKIFARSPSDPLRLNGFPASKQLGQ